MGNNFKITKSVPMKSSSYKLTGYMCPYCKLPSKRRDRDDSGVYNLTVCDGCNKLYRFRTLD